MKDLCKLCKAEEVNSQEQNVGLIHVQFSEIETLIQKEEKVFKTIEEEGFKY